MLMSKDSVVSMARLADAITDMYTLYRALYAVADAACLPRALTQRVCRNNLAKRARELGMPNPELKHPGTGEVSPLSDWVCDYMELTPEEWGGQYFADAGLEEVHSIAVGG